MRKKIVSFLLILILGIPWAQAESLQLNLNSGWNVISLPLQPADGSLPAVLQSINGQYRDVWQDKIEDTVDRWKHYHPDLADFSDLKQLQAQGCYWIYAAGQTSLVISGVPAVGDRQIGLAQGWNPFAWPYFYEQPIAQALQGLTYTNVARYNSDLKKWEFYSGIPALDEFNTFEPGRAYYLKVSQTEIFTLRMASSIPGQPSVDNYSTPVNISSQTISGSKPAQTALWINGAEAVPLNDALSWSAQVTLKEGDNFLAVSAKNSSGIGSAPVIIKIVLDTAAPSGQIKINSDAFAVNTQTVALNLSAQDQGAGLGQMMFSNDATVWSTPQAYAETAAWTLESGDGTKKVYARFKDAAGNFSPNVYDEIVLDTKAPKLKEVSADGKYACLVVFDEPVSQADKPSSYLISPDVGVSAAVKLDATSYQLSFASTLVKNNSYTLTVIGVKDTAGNAIDPANASAVLRLVDIERLYIYHNGRRLAMEENGKVFYFHPDHLGSTSLMTDQAGSQVKYLEYQPYGETKLEQGALDVSRKFTGKELDDSTGLYDYGARQYEPRLGRFISADTVEPDLTNPQTLNRYAYCLNNPLKYVDPDGNWAFLPALYAYATVVVASPDTPQDVQMMALDAAQGDWGGVALDAVGIAAPGVSAVMVKGGAEAVSAGAKAIGAGRTAGKSLKSADEVGDVLKAADKAADAGKGAKKIRLRHNTSVGNLKKIEKSGKLKSSKDGFVYVEKAKPRPKGGIVKGNPAEKAKELGIKSSKANAGVDVTVDSSRVTTTGNPVTGGKDIVIKGDVDLKAKGTNPAFFRRKK